MNYKELRTKYPKFYYHKFSWEIQGQDLCVNFSFSAGDSATAFSPKIILKNVAGKYCADPENKALFDKLVFNLGMVEMFSYWKAFCSPQIVIESATLSKEQVKFWQKLLLNGMGQYFYENDIAEFALKDFVEFVYTEGGHAPSRISLEYKYLLGIGGGKDSAVAGEILKKSGKPFASFIINPIPQSYAICKASDSASCLIAERQIDKKLFELNRNGYLNGHTPFSALVAFAGILCSASLGFKYFCVANESSADEETLVWKRKKINHQYSKTSTFEEDFSVYVARHISGDLGYFSVIRPMSELVVAKAFAKQTKYHPIFLSCNNAQKTVSGTQAPTYKWCANCSKCLFAYVMLAPFLSQSELIKIFGEDLFAKAELLPDLLAICGFTKGKPLECVGTKLEALLALEMTLSKYLDSKEGLPVLLLEAQKLLKKRPITEKEEQAVLDLGKAMPNMPVEIYNSLRETL